MIEIPSSNLRKVNTELNRIGRELIKKHKTIPGAVNKAMVVEGNELRNKIIESMRNTPRAGYFRRSGKGRTIKHHPSVKGNPPAIDTGELIRSILYDVEKMELRVGSVAGTVTKDGRSYASILELSKNPNMKRPWLEPAVRANFKKIIDNVTAAVKREFKF